MLLALIIILILIWAAVIWSIYSNFVVFYSNFSESENYHKAYYASISALERWELVTKQRSPGYVWSGGFVMWIWQGTFSNWWSDSSLSNFSYLWSDGDVSTVFRTVNSRTTRVPSKWNGDVEWMLSADDSSGYNMMGYENSEVFLLYYDDSTNNPYESGGVTQSALTTITWEIRLPKLLLNWGFWLLDTDASLVWKGDELPKDDAIVDWQMRWKYRDGTYYPFTIYSTQSTSRSNVHYSLDSIFRESDINNPLRFWFSSKWSPIVDSSEINHKNNDVSVTVVGQKANDVMNLNKFNGIFNKVSDNGIYELSLRFSLLNLLKAVNSGHTYPFLEYYADFWTNVSDKYYTINWEWNFKDFQINTIIQKPTVKDTVLWSFTSIF